MTITDKTLIEKMGFIAKAIGKDSCRTYLNVFKCESERIVSTDGKRLHILSVAKDDTKIMGLEVGGFYQMIVANKKMVSFEKAEEVDFPAFDKIIPAIDPLTKLDIILGNRKKAGTHREISKLIKAMPEDKAINFEYLFDLPQASYTVEIHPTVTVFNNEVLGIKAIIASIVY